MFSYSLSHNAAARSLPCERGTGFDAMGLVVVECVNVLRTRIYEPSCREPTRGTQSLASSGGSRRSIPHAQARSLEKPGHSRSDSVGPEALGGRGGLGSFALEARHRCEPGRRAFGVAVRDVACTAGPGGSRRIPHQVVYIVPAGIVCQRVVLSRGAAPVREGGASGLSSGKGSRRSKGTWLEIVQRWRRSGQTAEAYAQRHGLHAGTLAVGGSKLRSELAAAREPVSGGSGSGFLPVRVVSAPACVFRTDLNTHSEST